MICYQKNKYYLCDALVRLLFSQQAMKRESGENPEQTRYCKSYATFRHYFGHYSQSTQAVFCKEIEMGRQSEMG